MRKRLQIVRAVSAKRQAEAAEQRGNGSWLSSEAAARRAPSLEASAHFQKKYL